MEMRVSNHIDQCISGDGGVVRNRTGPTSVESLWLGSWRRDLSAMTWTVVLGVMTMVLPAYAGDIIVSGPIPPSVYEIELTYVGEQPSPTVTLQGPPRPVSPLPYRPFVPILELQSGLGKAKSFGPCSGKMTNTDRGIDLRWSGEGGARCGQRIELRPGGVPIDLMSYQSLRLRGRATGQVVVALEDLAGGRREDNKLLATVTGLFDVTVSFKDIGRRLDLRYLTALVVFTETDGEQISFEQIEASQDASGGVRPPGTGFWVWNYRAAVQDPGSVFATCRMQACSRIMIQMPSQSDEDALWRDYAALLVKMQEDGIEALALDGYPEAIQEPHKLADKIQRLLGLVEPGALFGVQFDIEPYLVPGFLEDEAQLRRYIEAIERLKDAIAGRSRLSMVIPFWLSTPTIGGRPLAYAVMDRADEVAVMSYRTDLDEVQDIAEDILRYGDVIGTPVWLAVETTALPVEQHVVLRREMDPARAVALLDHDRGLLQWAPVPLMGASPSLREWFRIHHRFTVRPERLTFAGRSRAEVSMFVKQMLGTASHPSFAGVIVHDLDGFRALAE
jgi:hypothetical protein